LEFINNFSGGPIKAYISGLDSNNKVVFVKPDGSLLYPTARGSPTPVEVSNDDIAIRLPPRGGKFKLNIPPLSSGRVYFAEGSLRFFMVRTDDGEGVVQPSASNLADPSVETNWGFVEFTYNPNGSVFANISYVDFVGFLLSMALTTKDGTASQVTKGLSADAVGAICSGLASQGKRDQRNWGAMCIASRSGVPIRVLSPNSYHEIRPEVFADYWKNYVDNVWRKYSGNPLTVDSQGTLGKFKCRVMGARLFCDGDGYSYSKPTTEDIWGCNTGPFARRGDRPVHVAFISRFCAAFHRTTFLDNGGNVQPSLPASSYYKSHPTNHYSRLIHEYEVDGRG
jgi:hypothetical protein